MLRTERPLKSKMSEFNEFKPRLKSPKNRFKLSAGLNLEKFNTWNQQYLSPGLNLSRGSKSLNSALSCRKLFNITKTKFKEFEPGLDLAKPPTARFKFKSLIQILP